MKTNRFLTSLLSMVALFSVAFMTSCTEVEEDSGTPSLTLSTSALAFDADGVASDDNNGSVTITSNRDWVVVIPDAAQSWLTASTESGTGNGSVSFSMPASDSYNTAQVSIQVLNDWGVALEEVLTVTQGEVGEAGSATEVAFTIDTTAISAGAGTTVIGGYSFDYSGISLDSSYGTIYIDVDTAGYIASASDIQNFTKLVIEGNGYVKTNLVVWVGTSADNATVVESSSEDGSGWGSFYDYEIPAGSTYVKFEANSAGTYDASVSAIDFYCDLGTEEGGSTTTPDEPSEDATLPSEDATFILNNTAMGISGSDLAGTATVGGYNFDYAGLSTDDSYGTIYIDAQTSGYIANTTEISNLTQIVIEGNGYVKTNLVVSVGSAANPTTVVESVSEAGSGWGSFYLYNIPAGSTYVTFTTTPDSTYDASVTAISFYCDLGTEEGGSTTTPDEPSEEEEDETALTTGALSALYTAEDGVELTLTGVTVDFVYGSYNYVSLNGASALVYGSDLGLSVGDIITVTGTVSTYSNVKQLGYATIDSTTTGGTPVSAIELTAAEYIANYGDYLNQFIYIKDLSVSDTDLTAADGSAFSYYNRYGLSDLPTSGTCDVYGYGSYYSSVQIYPTEFTNVVAGEPEVVDGTQIFAADFGLENAVAVETTTISGYTFSFAGSGSTTAKYYSSGNGTIRFYKGDVMTIASADGSDITSIIFDTDGSTTMVANVGEMDTDSKTWTGSASSVEFTASQTEKVESFVIK